MAKKEEKELFDSIPPDLDSQINGLIGDEPGKSSGRIPARIVSLPLKQIVPDRFHARMILPSSISKQFYSHEIDCYEAAKLLQKAAQKDGSLQKMVNGLLLLGESILENFQIQPATGYWARNKDGEHYFFLEVGTRRFWGLALAYVDEGMTAEPVLEIAEARESGGFRQIAENAHTKGLCAIELARAIALLVLMEEDVFPDANLEEEGDHFRRVLGGRTISQSTWEAISAILNRPPDVLQQHLQFLTLPDEMQYQAALHRLPASVLQEINSVPKRNQADMLSAALDKSRMTADGEVSKSKRETGTAKTAAQGGETGRAEVLAHYILNWLEVAEDTRNPGEFADVAEELGARLRTSEEMDLLARRLTNLARDVRVKKTSSYY